MAFQKGSALTARLLCLTASLVIFSGLAGATQPEWQTITSFKNVRRMRLINDTLFVATSGGILAITDVDTPSRQFVNLDGLGTTDITDIIEDAEGQKWVTGFGRLIKFSEGNSKQFLFEKDNSLLTLYLSVDDGENLWVGTNTGLVFFSKSIDEGQIQDSYGQFGNLSANPDVNDIMLVGDTIWIATSAGLAVANKTNPALLKSPLSWTVFTADDYPELGAANIRRVVWFEGSLYVATSHGMFRLDRSPSDTSFAIMPIGVNRTFFDLKIENDSLFFYYNNGMGVVKNSAFSSLSTSSLPSAPVTGANTGTFRWVGSSGVGLFHDQDSSGLFVEYVYTGPPDNIVADVTVDAEGVLTGGFYEVRKAAQYDGKVWTEHYFRSRITDMVLDSSGDVWVATWGNGVWVIREDTVVNYDENNSTMRGIGVNPIDYAYVTARGLATDGKYIYAACFLAVNGYPIAIGDLNNLDSPSGWDSLGTGDGVSNKEVITVDCFDGWIAVGTKAAGVYRCYLSDDPFDHTVRDCRYYTESDGLISNDIRVVKFAPDGNLWVGTNFGLSRWDLDRFIDVTPPPGIGPDITALEFDGRGNMWIGSKNGLGRVDGATGAPTVYTTRNSGLVSDDITNLSWDPFTGDLYIATSAGISRMKSTIGRPTAELEAVVAFPNPFVIRSDSDRLNFNFSRSATVRLFTVAGELVAEFPVNTSWGGRNQRGEKVVSGVYVYILTDKDGNVERGKVLVIREE